MIIFWYLMRYGSITSLVSLLLMRCSCQNLVCYDYILVLDEVELIGASPAAIAKAEDRNQFREAMRKIGLETPRARIVHSLGDAAEDPDIRATVLTGAGDRAFCAGQDLNESAGLDSADERVESLISLDVQLR